MMLARRMLLLRTPATSFRRIDGREQVFHGRKCVELRTLNRGGWQKARCGKNFFKAGVTNPAAIASTSKAASVAFKTSSRRESKMTIRTRTALFVSAAVVSLAVALAPAAYAADDMKKDTMSKDTMSKDSMKKDTMSKDTMSKDSMKKDDGMKKDDTMKK